MLTPLILGGSVGVQWFTENNGQKISSIVNYIVKKFEGTG